MPTALPLAMLAGAIGMLVAYCGIWIIAEVFRRKQR
jgi:hypothetical protein